jgi:2-polyprenyl-3-methyl-5-hydroxy-6-metoxy-1,4-benzoquinol methylase
VPPGELPEHVAENRRHWDEMAGDWVARGARCWAMSEPSWGEFDIPESQVGMLPADMSGVDAIELGCGTGYVSGWMARRGARVVGIDNSEAQLATARRLAGEHGADLTLLHGNAEAVPYPDASFDFAISEYGAAI